MMVWESSYRPDCGSLIDHRFVFFSLGVRISVRHHHQHLLASWCSGATVYEEEILCEDSDFYGGFSRGESGRKWLTGPDSGGEHAQIVKGRLL